jgi:hypothetical protein
MIAGLFGALVQHADRLSMPRTTINALIALIAVAFGLAISPASGQSDVDCAEIYKSHLEKLKRENISPERRDALRRWALRVYNACQSGDVQDAKGLFEKLDRNLP